MNAIIYEIYKAGDTQYTKARRLLRHDERRHVEDDVRISTWRRRPVRISRVQWPGGMLSLYTNKVTLCDL